MQCYHSYPLGICEGQCSGVLPPVGTVCDTCNKVKGTESRLMNCVDGTIPQTGTIVNASCTGWYECGCGNDWTAVTGMGPGTFFCGATGDYCDS